MPKLTETQAVLLSAAAARRDLRVLPAPKTLEVEESTLGRPLRTLLRRGLINVADGEGGRKPGKRAGAHAAAGPVGNFVITAAGLAAIGVEASEPEAPAPAGEAAVDEPLSAPEPTRPAGKLALLLDAVSARDGATIDELTRLSGWLPHTARAAITRLRQRGHPVSLVTIGGRRAYRLGGTT
jgi:hypothetical protein